MQISLKRFEVTLEIRPLVALSPSLYNVFNRKGTKCHRHEHTNEGGGREQNLRSQHLKSAFLWGGGYKAARGLISGDFTLDITGIKLL